MRGSTTSVRHHGGLRRMTARQVDVALELLVIGAIATGLLSWSLGDRWNGWAAAAHGVLGLSLLLLVPAKLRGSVQAGFRRRASGRWLSASLGVLVLAAAGLGLLHATGLWHGVGQWTALWTHELFGFAVVPLFIWHVVTRPRRPGLGDLDRRALLRLSIVGAAAAALHTLQRPVSGMAGLVGDDRRHTGSHEIASHEPAGMPTVIWFDDSRPEATDPATWELRVQGRPVAIASLWEAAGPIVATLDCTGGWWSEQSWNAVALSALLRDPRGRSVRVRSSTGYTRRFPLGDLDAIYLAVGYEGRPLRPGHGAPVRLVVPGRRGFEWVKWVTSIDDDARPAWLQPPLPLT